MRNLLALVALILSAFGPGVSWAGYCVQVVTVPIVETKGGSPVNVNLLVPVALQPGDPSVCALVLVSGAEWSNLNTMSLGWLALNSGQALDASNIGVLRTDVNTLRTDVNTLRTDVNNQSGAISTNLSSMSTLLNYQTAPFDLNFAMSAFAFFFSTTLFIFAVSRGSGAILEKIRKPMGHG